MPLIPLKRIRIRRPNKVVPIDWSSPISKDLVLSSYLGEGVGTIRDLVKGKKATLGSTTAWKITKGGKGLTSDSISNANWFEWANADIPTIDEDLTIQVTFVPNFDSTDGGAAGFQYIAEATPGNNDAFRLVWRDTLDWRFRFFTSSGGTNLDAAGNGFNAGDIVTLHFTYDGSNMYIYENGLLLGSVAKTGTFSNGTTPWRFMLGGGSNNAESLNGTILIVNVWERALDSRECLEMSDNSYQMLQPRTQLLPLTVGVAPTFKAAWATNATTVQSLQGMS